MTYEEKYLKYKSKYMDLKLKQTQSGGGGQAFSKGAKVFITLKAHSTDTSNFNNRFKHIRTRLELDTDKDEHQPHFTLLTFDVNLENPNFNYFLSNEFKEVVHNAAKMCFLKKPIREKSIELIGNNGFIAMTYEYSINDYISTEDADKHKIKVANDDELHPMRFFRRFIWKKVSDKLNLGFSARSAAQRKGGFDIFHNLYAIPDYLVDNNHLMHVSIAQLNEFETLTPRVTASILNDKLSINLRSVENGIEKNSAIKPHLSAQSLLVSPQFFTQYTLSTGRSYDSCRTTILDGAKLIEQKHSPANNTNFIPKSKLKIKTLNLEYYVNDNRFLA